MSYDFMLFVPQPGVDPLITAQAELEEDEGTNPVPPVPAKEARKNALATELMKANPALKVFPFEFDKIAKHLGISIEDARMQFRHLELNGAEDGNGIQLMLYDNRASVTVPYWHKGQKAKAVFEEIWNYFRIMQSGAGYHIYDPQMERLVDLRTDLADATRSYLDGVKHVDGIG
jgi:hypothetical protein